MEQYFYLVFFRTNDSSLFFTLPILITGQDLTKAEAHAQALVQQVSTQFDVVISPSAPLRYQPTRHKPFFEPQFLPNPITISVMSPLASVLSQPSQAGLIVSVAVLSAGVTVAPCYSI